MKDNKYSPYATNKGGKIESPRNVREGEPKATAVRGDDLRASKQKPSK